MLGERAGGRAAETAVQAVDAPAPLCFVLTPPEPEADARGTVIDFDAVYRELIAPSVLAAGLEPIRADADVANGPVFERLMLCEYAVADLTFATANAFYELGMHQAVRPYSTVLVFAAGARLPLDVAPERALPYRVNDSGRPTDLVEVTRRLTQRLVAARDRSEASPVFHLVERFPDISRLKTDVFRDRVHYSPKWKAQLGRAREAGLDAVRAVESDLGNLADVEVGILIDLLLSYRAVNGYDNMVALVEKMPRPLATTALVREQLGLALNRLGRRSEAERVLLALMQQRGVSGEAYGILGRIYKDQWNDARRAGEELAARSFLAKAINAYLAGFEADWRDAYPGINAVTLMEISEPPDRRRTDLIPLVTYAVDRRLGSDQADYWDHAARLEIAVLANEEAAAKRALTAALAMVRERWEPESTAMNLRLIREARQQRGEQLSWAEELEQELLRSAGH